MLIKAGLTLLSLLFSVQIMAQTHIILGDDDPAPFPWSQCLLQQDALLGVWGYDLEDADEKFIIINDTTKGFWLDISIVDRTSKVIAEGLGVLLNDEMSLFARLESPDSSPMHLTITSYCDKSGSRKLMNARIEYFDKFNSSLDYTLHRVK
ncbi:MAG: hypothetical protein MK008_03390 [Bdellovibrionales bacterium]|nr:hypothetical protein [Bdellovibrionales bacterium]